MDVIDDFKRLLVRCPTAGSLSSVHRLLQLQPADVRPGITVSAVQECLLDPALTLPAITILRRHVLAAISTLVHAVLNSRNAARPSLELSLALASVLELAPHADRLALAYWRAAPSPWAHALDPGMEGRAAAHAARAGLRALRRCRDLAGVWSWPAVLPLLRHSSPGVRWAGIHLTAVLLGLADADARGLEARLLSPEELAAERRVWQEEAAAFAVEAAAALAPWDRGRARPASRKRKATRSILAGDGSDSDTSSSERFSGDEGVSSSASRGKAGPQPTLAVPGYVRIAGVDLPQSTGPGPAPPTTLPASRLVSTPGMLRTLRGVALGLCAASSVLLEGPPGSGKSTLLRHLEEVTGSAAGAIHLHLDDQTDSKGLMGAYVCTARPGEFVWRAGPLTQAVAQGRWLVVEDINLAPPEVLAALIPLAERRQLHVAARGQTLTAHPGFQLFATVTSTPQGVGAGAYGSAAAVMDMLGGLFHHVKTDAPGEEDQAIILRTLYPALGPTLLGTALRMLYLARAMYGQLPADECPSWLPAEYGSLPSLQGVGRHFSLRDLARWAARMGAVHARALAAAGSLLGTRQATSPVAAGYVDAGSALHSLPAGLRLAACMEACDMFAGFLADEHDAGAVRTVLSTLWCVVPAEVEHAALAARPTLARTGAALAVGRATLPATGPPPLPSTFAPTGQALRLMERAAVAAAGNEPLLLVGETGTGKTTLVQQLASQAGATLAVLNLSQQTDASDLLGGFRPVRPTDAALPLFERFQDLVQRQWPAGNNGAFIDRVARLAAKRHAGRLVKAFKVALAKLGVACPPSRAELAESAAPEPSTPARELRRAWLKFSVDVAHAEATLLAAEGGFSFAFMEGTLVQALRQGSWLLLDEINLAPPEALERMAGLLQDPRGSLVLAERGDAEPVPRHPAFRLFAAMNPATDAGGQWTCCRVEVPHCKRDLPAPLRNHFTEVWVAEPSQTEDLRAMVTSYLGQTTPRGVVEGVVSFYRAAKADRGLVDGAGACPVFNLRTLCRALEYVRAATARYGPLRALADGFDMAFGTALEARSAARLRYAIQTHLLGGAGYGATTSGAAGAPPGDCHVCVEGYWLERGPGEAASRERDAQGRVFMETPAVRAHVRNLARALVLRRCPILLQGPTSSGKTSLVGYLAARTGHACVRINNHDSTDLQEYLGRYVSDEHGRLVFAEGALVQAARRGDWVVLDELNLAPSDVLEALNRLLDDNRELFVPELQETIKPHPHFMLFATQNPPGLYAGRKALSRAFRSRFLEMQVDDIPPTELVTILEHRCGISNSDAARIVRVMQALQDGRAAGNVFAGRHGFITPRDLFRWAGRGGHGDELAINGFAVLGERLRNAEERSIVRQSIQTELRVKINLEEAFFTEGEKPLLELQARLRAGEVDGAMPGPETQALQKMLRGLVWTRPMQRMYALLDRCLAHEEPALLIGDTGTGKTTVCQMAAFVRGQRLHIFNCNQHTEASDLLGGFRPNRAPAAEGEAFVPFVWADGPLVQAMLQGDIILIDELNLAEDAVLERLNSVLEPGRTLTLAEKGGSAAEVIVAHPNFRVVATMNPGGDFGKKELSPALSNRFTTIWVPAATTPSELHAILSQRLVPAAQAVTQPLIDFWTFFNQEISASVRQALSMRDLMAWVEFINLTTPGLGAMLAYAHGAELILLDGLGLGVGLPIEVSSQLTATCRTFLLQQLSPEVTASLSQASQQPAMQRRAHPVTNHEQWGTVPFFVDVERAGPEEERAVRFDFDAPTTRRNTFRVLRAMQLPKAILLEGSPGVGKTSLVAALARAVGQTLVRVNLSEQTDMMDLLGADLPVDSGAAGTFAWSDGPLLHAIKTGAWLLLDELNLASQSVLEGLNAVLDHRSEVFIPELDQTFTCPPTFRVFGAQNPLQEGGGRKGLPRSFLNRFARVYVELLGTDDLHFIAGAAHPRIPPSTLQGMISFLARLQAETVARTGFAASGGPWEFNLRDLLRWCELVAADCSGCDAACRAMADGDGHEPQYPRDPCDSAAAHHGHMLFTQRLRTAEDRARVGALLSQTWPGHGGAPAASPAVHLTPQVLRVGRAEVARSRAPRMGGAASQPLLALLPSKGRDLEGLARAVGAGWMGLVVGPAGAGKTALIRTLAELAGRDLTELSLTEGTDTSDLLGGFEQLEPMRRVQGAVGVLSAVTRCWEASCEALPPGASRDEGEGQEQMGRAASLLLLAVDGLLAQLARHSPSTAALQECMRGLVSHLDLAQQRLGALLAEAEASEHGVAGRFEWVDGPLTRAVTEGGWVLLDNANLCNPTVLDRLNPLLEPGGHLTLNECGTASGKPRVLLTHPDFRLFMAMDPRHGEVSRAMRNRGVELFLPDWTLGEGAARETAELCLVLEQAGIEEQALQSSMCAAHAVATVQAAGHSRRPPGLGALKRWALLARSLVARGWGASEALTASFGQLYGGEDGQSPLAAAHAADSRSTGVTPSHGLVRRAAWPLPRDVAAAAEDATAFSVARRATPAVASLVRLGVELMQPASAGAAPAITPDALASLLSTAPLDAATARASVVLHAAQGATAELAPWVPGHGSAASLWRLALACTHAAAVWAPGGAQIAPSCLLPNLAQVHAAASALGAPGLQQAVMVAAALIRELERYQGTLLRGWHPTEDGEDGMAEVQVSGAPEAALPCAGAPLLTRIIHGAVEARALLMAAILHVRSAEDAVSPLQFSYWRHAHPQVGAAPGHRAEAFSEYRDDVGLSLGISAKVQERRGCPFQLCSDH
ncbi:hypothetical protein APUTEX25_000764 [Auxenochlorella protothecoides]|uniref:Midasin n=1 Tax=Auxenochlorella protothecoides TaxID=3075 RepID=A0A3M7KSG1_AUXPR|nr:hypothetical protein APUTEX25_000764 [Auxenochlorella protothecoides]|eukprot:RMZ52645.1 hypothetical protein APUTEX25_000764 [Auxenochlorella protothecoides]